MKIEKTSLADKLLKSLEEPATEELLSDKLLKMLGDDTKSAKEYYDEETSGWQMVETKEVEDSDGFMTEYTWYTDNKTKHIFMFGDRDLYSPDEEYADWSIEIDERNPDASFQQAQDWFDNYHGFGSEDYTDEYEDSGAEMDVTHDPLTPVEEGSATEDTVKQGSHWVNKGKEGTHGKFRTKKAADAQRKAMFANGYTTNEALDYTIEIEGSIYQDEDGNPYRFDTFEHAREFIEENELEGAEVTRQYGRVPRRYGRATESDDKTINVYNPNVTVHNNGQIGKIKNKEESFATEGVKGILKKYNAELVPGEVDKTYRFKTREDGNNCEKEIRKLGVNYKMNSNGDIIFPSVAKESIRGQVSNNLSKSVYENFIGNKEVRHDNKKR